MTPYMIELHNVPHELELFVSELSLYGEITYQNPRYPTFVWMESFWDKDILESSLGVKTVRPKREETEPAWLNQ